MLTYIAGWTNARICDKNYTSKTLYRVDDGTYVLEILEHQNGCTVQREEPYTLTPEQAREFVARAYNPQTGCAYGAERAAELIT